MLLLLLLLFHGVSRHFCRVDIIIIVIVLWKGRDAKTLITCRLGMVRLGGQRVCVLDSYHVRSALWRRVAIMMVLLAQWCRNSKGEYVVRVATPVCLVRGRPCFVHLYVAIAVRLETGRQCSWRWFCFLEAVATPKGARHFLDAFNKAVRRAVGIPT